MTPLGTCDSPRDPWQDLQSPVHESLYCIDNVFFFKLKSFCLNLCFNILSPLWLLQVRGVMSRPESLTPTLMASKTQSRVKPLTVVC